MDFEDNNFTATSLEVRGSYTYKQCLKINTASKVKTEDAGGEGKGPQ